MIKAKKASTLSNMEADPNPKLFINNKHIK